jgi:uncharacterized damage-inducible protein DinB
MPTGRELASTFGISAYAAQANTQDVSHEESVTPPPNGGNTINWILGHILASRDVLAARLGDTPFLTEEETKLYGRGSAPVGPDTPCAPFERLLEGLAASTPALQRRLDAMTEEDLAMELEQSAFPVPVEVHTLGSLLTFLLFHESYHVGQLGIVRRTLGKPGVIA